jgi:IclR family transcriptional regulator, KDG regulon repressor
MANDDAENNSNEAKYNIRVLDRAFTVLELLSDGKPRTALDVSKGINLNLSTTFRLLSTMCYYDYIHRDEFDKYSLGLACLELARAYQSSNDLRKIALVEMENLRDELKETVHLAVLDKMGVVYIEKLPGLHPIGLLGSQIGGRSPSYCTGVGKALIAYLDPEQIRAYYASHEMLRFTPHTITDINQLMNDLAMVRINGYSVDDQEHEVDVCCVAAPIFNMNRQAVAALSVSGPNIRMDPVRENKEVIEKVKQTVFNISRQLGYRP